MIKLEETISEKFKDKFFSYIEFTKICNATCKEYGFEPLRRQRPIRPSIRATQIFVLEIRYVANLVYSETGQIECLNFFYLIDDKVCNKSYTKYSENKENSIR